MENLLRRKVLVTGATGFIGTAFCLRARREGWQVRGAVRSVSDHNNLPPRVEAVPVGMIGPVTEWVSSMEGVEILVHLASRTHVMRETASNPLAEYRKVNVVGTEHLARQAAAAGIKRLVFLSSVKVNGEGRLDPYTEDDLPAPEDHYGVSKLEAEEVLWKVSAETGMEVVILRSPLVYGPGVKANFLSLLKAVHGGIPLPFGSIRNKRSFIYLDNLVDAIAVCLTHLAAVGSIYLVSDGDDISTPELIRKVAFAFERPVRLFAFPPRLIRFIGSMVGKGDTVNRLVGALTVDTRKIRQELDWHPPYNMEQGLRETADWFYRDYLG